MAEDPKQTADPPRDEEPAEAGTESYGGDADAEPSVTPEEVRRGGERDQAEG